MIIISVLIRISSYLINLWIINNNNNIIYYLKEQIQHNIND